MFAKRAVDIVDQQLHQTQISGICVSKTTTTLKTNPAPKYLKLGEPTSPNFNFDYMCVKNNVDIVDKSCTKISQIGEPLEINVDIVDNTASPILKVNQAS